MHGRVPMRYDTGTGPHALRNRGVLAAAKHCSIGTQLHWHVSWSYLPCLPYRYWTTCVLAYRILPELTSSRHCRSPGIYATHICEEKTWQLWVILKPYSHPRRSDSAGSVFRKATVGLRQSPHQGRLLPHSGFPDCFRLTDSHNCL
jgi:hypothetical protein